MSLNIGQADPVPAIDLTKEYTIATVDYVATGGKYWLLSTYLGGRELMSSCVGDFFIPKSEQQPIISLDTLDVVFSNYVSAHSPVNVGLSGRISQVLASRRRWSKDW